MYSLVLMTAMAGTPDAAGFGGSLRDRFLGCGCNGITAGCYGTNYSCNGCGGGSCNGGLFSGDRLRSAFSFFGGCSCSGCNGCCGAVSYGCGAVTYSSCIGSTINPGMDMPGSPYAVPQPIGVPMIPPTALPTDGLTPYAQPAPAETREYTPNNQLPPPGGLVASPSRGTVIVKLPADAKLYAEGKQLDLTTAERTYVTPELPQGRDYNYTFKVEYSRDGRVVSENRTLTVTPGRISTVEFSDQAPSKVEGAPIPKQIPESKPMTNTTTTSLPKAEPAGDRARIMVTVPTGATLFVNDVKLAGSEFRTPPLPAGKTFSYTMKIETIRNGQPETATQKVTIRGGDSIAVDFSNNVAGR